MKICLLINFGKPRVDVKRIILGNLEEEPQMNTGVHG
jgi:hypothetical protein